MTVKELVEIIEPDTYVYFVCSSKNEGIFDLLPEGGFCQLMHIPYLILKGVEDSNVLGLTNYYHCIQRESILRIVCEVS